jgi:hypothetical protein
MVRLVLALCAAFLIYFVLGFFLYFVVDGLPAPIQTGAHVLPGIGALAVGFSWAGGRR